MEKGGRLAAVARRHCRIKEDVQHRWSSSPETCLGGRFVSGTYRCAPRSCASQVPAKSLHVPPQPCTQSTAAAPNFALNCSAHNSATAAEKTHWTRGQLPGRADAWQLVLWTKLTVLPWMRDAKRNNSPATAHTLFFSSFNFCIAMGMLSTRTISFISLINCY